MKGLPFHFMVVCLVMLCAVAAPRAGTMAGHVRVTYRTKAGEIIGSFVAAALLLATSALVIDWLGYWQLFAYVEDLGDPSNGTVNLRGIAPRFWPAWTLAGVAAGVGLVILRALTLRSRVTWRRWAWLVSLVAAASIVGISLVPQGTGFLKSQYDASNFAQVLATYVALWAIGAGIYGGVSPNSKHLSRLQTEQDSD